MDGRTYEADKTFKTVLSTKELTMRRKYDRRISTIKRRCSFAGSGNNLYIVREQQNRRIIPIEIEKIYFSKLAQIDLIDLFMEAYHLLINGFEYSYKKENINDLYHLYSDYVQQSDIDLIIDDFINKPIDDNEYLISSLDLVNTLLMHYQNFTRRINVVAIGKLMTDKGYERVRKGRDKTLFYKISKHSKIVPFLTSDSQSHLAN
jgi:predicted P-loop ATPase